MTAPATAERMVCEAWISPALVRIVKTSLGKSSLCEESVDDECNWGIYLDLLLGELFLACSVVSCDSQGDDRGEFCDLPGANIVS